VTQLRKPFQQVRSPAQLNLLFSYTPLDALKPAGKHNYCTIFILCSNFLDQVYKYGTTKTIELSTVIYNQPDSFTKVAYFFLDRKLVSLRCLIMSADSNPDSATKSRSKPWKTALLLLGSVAFGGLAIAFWNRNELTQMRDQKNAPTPGRSPSSLPSDDEAF
jgi:hypothetical protein